MATDALARDSLLPRADGRLGPGAALALLAHAGLIGALALGLNWRLPRQATPASAELWAAVPQAAAPRAIPELPQPAAPTPQPRPVTPVTPVTPPQPSAAEREAEIALEKASQRKKEQQAEAARAAAQRERQRKEQEDAQRQKLKLEKALEDKRLADEKTLALKSAQKLAQQRDKQARDDKAREDKRLQDLADQRARQQKAEEAKAQDALLARQREENLKRMLGQAGLAGATGAANATGNASHDAAPSASYGGRIKAAIKPLIIYTTEVVGNPTAEVEVKCAPDGSIVSRRVTKASGNPAWDEAVLRAIDRARALPRDTDGRIPPTMLLTFSRQE